VTDTDKPLDQQPHRLPDSAPHTVSHMFGEIVWLMTQAPTHKHFALTDLEWMVMPPLLLGQFRLFHDQGRPVGAALWAFLSEEAEAKMSLTPPRLRPDEWKSGDRCWVIDLIAPGANAENKLAGIMLTDLQRTALGGCSFRFNRTSPTGVRDIVTIGALADAS
jgi:cytolysin-activating lysine-acyltransferase